MKDIFRSSMKWSMTIAVITFVLAALFSIVSNSILNEVDWVTGLLVVLVIVLIGIIFDMIGIASTAADPVPFHSMASRKVFGAKHSILIVRNADRFASFCNDVIGDISGIISGSAGAVVIIHLTVSFRLNESTLFEYMASVLITSLIASLTVGGKALGKTFAIRYSNDIIFQVGKILHFLEEKFHIIIMKENRRKKQRNHKKRK